MITEDETIKIRDLYFRKLEDYAHSFHTSREKVHLLFTGEVLAYKKIILILVFSDYAELVNAFDTADFKTSYDLGKIFDRDDEAKVNTLEIFKKNATKEVRDRLYIV